MLEFFFNYQTAPSFFCCLLNTFAASSIGRVFAFESSDPSLNTGGTSFVVATICATSIFQITDSYEELDSTANFNSLDLGKKEM